MNTSIPFAFASESPMPPSDTPLALPALKIALLLLTAISTHYSLTPPHTAAPKTILPNKTLFERGILWVTWCTKVRLPPPSSSDGPEWR